jgi:hypothetical protein
MPNETNIPAAPVVPVFAAPIDRKQSNLMDRDAYGEYVMALRQWRFDPGQRNNPSWRAHVVILESTNPNYPVGTETQLHFPVGRPGTVTDPAKPEKDAERIHAFMKVLAKKTERGWDSQPLQKKLHAAGRIQTDELKFALKREQGNTVKRYNNKTEKLEEITYEKDKLSIVA